MAKVRFTTYVSQEVLDELRLFSAETRVPAAQYVEEALKDLLNKYKKSIKEEKEEKQKESGVLK